VSTRIALLRREGITDVYGLPGAAISTCYAALRVAAPDEIGPAFDEAKKLMATCRAPVVVERVTNISMGTELDTVTGFEELAARREHAATAAVAMLD